MTPFYEEDEDNQPQDSSSPFEERQNPSFNTNNPVADRRVGQQIPEQSQQPLQQQIPQHLQPEQQQRTYQYPPLEQSQQVPGADLPVTDSKGLGEKLMVNFNSRLN